MAGPSGKPRMFELRRHQDVSGVSGEGVVAHVVEYPNGKVTVAWCGVVQSINVYDSLDDVLRIHGHGGLTELVELDP